MHKVGILGGSFNPIHYGHLLLAEWAGESLGLEKIIFLPAGTPYFKSGSKVLPGEERLHMTQLAVKENAHFQCLDLEIKRSGPTYTYETLIQLHKLYPDTQFFFLCGADCLYTIGTWKCPELIFANCTLVAVVRDDASAPEMEAKKQALESAYDAKIILLPFLRYSISSTEIRERVKNRKSIRYLVPEPVRNYILEKEFYRE
ncbi:MAG: nicotinate-nucleotide adenylyltransferase [Acetatifactor sp.]